LERWAADEERCPDQQATFIIRCALHHTRVAEVPLERRALPASNPVSADAVTVLQRTGEREIAVVLQASGAIVGRVSRVEAERLVAALGGATWTRDELGHEVVMLDADDRLEEAWR
jgi:hypothetical protein